MTYVLLFGIWVFLSKAMDRWQELKMKERLRSCNAKCWRDIDDMNNRAHRDMLEVIRIQSGRQREARFEDRAYDIIGVDYDGKSYFGDWKIERRVMTVRRGQKRKSFDPLDPGQVELGGVLRFMSRGLDDEVVCDGKFTGRWPTRTPETLARSLLYQLVVLEEQSHDVADHLMPRRVRRSA